MSRKASALPTFHRRSRSGTRLPAAIGWALRAVKVRAKNRQSSAHKAARGRKPTGSAGRAGRCPSRHSSQASRAAAAVGRYTIPGTPSRTPAQKQTPSSAQPYTAVSSGVRPGARGPSRRASSQPGRIRSSPARRKNLAPASQSAPLSAPIPPYPARQTAIRAMVSQPARPMEGRDRERAAGLETGRRTGAATGMAETSLEVAGRGSARGKSCRNRAKPVVFRRILLLFPIIAPEFIRDVSKPCRSFPQGYPVQPDAK